MRYVQLRAFHYVAVKGGFSRAAEALNLTQPAISDQVRKLEAEYDVRLFDRQHKKVIVTRAGKKLLKITHRLFEMEDRAHALLAESKTQRGGTLNIMVDSALHMLHVLGPFAETYRDVRVKVSVGNSRDVVESLINYEADIAVSGQIPEGREYESVRLGSTPLVAFVARTSPLAARKHISFEELVRQPLVLREKGSRTRYKIQHHAREAGLSLTVAIEAEGREAVREIVAGGSGVGIVSQAEFGHDYRLVQIPITGTHLEMEEALICLRERWDNRLIRAFMTLASQAGNAGSISPSAGSPSLGSRKKNL